jgi:hypothetical protein
LRVPTFRFGVFSILLQACSIYALAMDYDFVAPQLCSCSQWFLIHHLDDVQGTPGWLDLNPTLQASLLRHKETKINQE